MFEQNGIQMYAYGEEQPLPKGIRNTMSGTSLYGYRIVHEAAGPIWIDATESDYRRSEAKRLGIEPTAVELPKYGECGGKYPNCQGGCYGSYGGSCYAAVNPEGGHYYCGCHSS
jgi:hypothetical protein